MSEPESDEPGGPSSSKGQRAGSLIFEHNGFYYHKKKINQSEGKTYFVCAMKNKKGCKATARWGPGENEFVLGKKPHNHLREHGKLEAEEIQQKIIDECIKYPRTSFHTIYQKHTLE